MPNPCRPCRGPLNEGRSLNPGDTLTRGECKHLPHCAGPLNEGRSLNPGDTMVGLRPGGMGAPPWRTLNEGRSLNPGDTLNRDEVGLVRGDAVAT